jgi:hypothetical protein
VPSPFTPDTRSWAAVSPYVGDPHRRALFSVRETERAFELLRKL